MFDTFCFKNEREIVSSIFQQNVGELENLLACNMLCFANTDHKGHIFHEDPTEFLMESQVDFVVLSAGSPKLQTAFSVITKDK